MIRKKDFEFVFCLHTFKELWGVFFTLNLIETTVFKGAVLAVFPKIHGNFDLLPKF